MGAPLRTPAWITNTQSAVQTHRSLPWVRVVSSRAACGRRKPRVGWGVWPGPGPGSTAQLARGASPDPFCNNTKAWNLGFLPSNPGPITDTAKFYLLITLPVPVQLIIIRILSVLFSVTNQHVLIRNTLSFRFGSDSSFRKRFRSELITRTRPILSRINIFRIRNQILFRFGLKKKSTIRIRTKGPETKTLNFTYKNFF